MAALKIFVFMMFCCWCTSNGCTWMKSSFHDLSSRSISNLKQACNSTHHYGNLSLEFPSKLYNQINHLQAKDHIVFILRALKNVMRLYHGKHENADCNQQKLQIFILDIHRQIAELERCETNMVVSEVNRKLSKKMEMHFKSLISHLKHTGYSASGWKDVAGMVFQHLSRLDVLATKTKQDLSL